MLLLAMLIAGLGLVPPLGTPSPSIELIASDGVHVFARSYDAPSPKAPVILLFHQAGSSKSEYATIAPRLVDLGFNVLATDQRSGGDLYQPQNETVLRIGHNAPNYDSALPDLEAALDWARRAHPASPVYAWGSSYSAALVFILAAKHPRDIAAVLAFSPGEYLADRSAVHRAAGRVHVPVFIDSAADPKEIASAKSIFDALPRSSRSKLYAPKAGIHGSSTLRPDRNPGGSEQNWMQVTRFLRSLR
jgi:dienelactone hydrolase